MFKNFSFLTFGRASGDFFNFLLFVLIARTFGQESIGHYSFAMALGGFCIAFADFGLYYLTIKELSHKVLPFGQSFASIWSLRIILAVSVTVALIFLTPFMPVSEHAQSLILIIGISFIFGTLVDGFSAVFIAHENMQLAGLLDFSHRVTGALTAIVVLLLGGNLFLAVGMLPIMAVVHSWGGYYLAKKRYGRLKLATSWSSVSKRFRSTIPYGLSELLGQMAMRTNIVLLGFLLGTTAAGTYNVAYRIVFSLIFFSIFVRIILLPMASSLHTQDKDQLVALYRNSLSLMVFFGLPTSCGIWLIAPDLIDLLYGKIYSESIPVLRILSALIFLFSVRNILGTFLTAVNLQSEKTKREAYGALSIITGNLLLIPIWGVLGSAFATIGSEILLLVLFIMPLSSILGWPGIGRTIVRSGIACFSFIVPFLFFSTAPLFAKVLVSIFLYFATLFLFTEVRQNELPKFWKLFRNSPRRTIPATEGNCQP
ncbi:flippase [Candidatus Nitrospira neomarina]|uniref:Flippase n=1 Tax=Candidatus Nitrospira neomarina TaxID=3020899 RepID=A0AA96JY11_9BACT|nr:flippase [Candidatus Nitrospira neomarina]WNM64003.1 flippase [Candidatus Nitrospira neomarina]